MRKVRQRDVIEVPFNLPQGVENHPAIVVSVDDIMEYEGIAVCVMITHNKTEDEFTFHLSPDMFTGNSKMTGYQARLQLISLFNVEKDIISNSNMNVQMKEADFLRMMKRIIQVTFGLTR